ncbi:MAG: hypothetical protein ABS58_04240 [Mesorhizobium sp. SCN 65-20]|nr:MAG: hypothetical protein ABS58_04240 [Mesorhizobium sp. SCN 65-20]
MSEYARCLAPEDLEMLARVLARSLPAASTSEDREMQAASLVCLFGSGVTDETRLMQLMKDCHRSYGPGSRPSLQSASL